MVDISIVVPTLGTRLDELERLLKSLSNQRVNLEIVIVSQGNYEAIQRMVEGYGDLSIHHVHNEEKGLSKARNTGLELCSGKIVTFSDDDCWYKVSSLERIVDYFNTKCNQEGLSFQIYDPLTNLPYKEYSNREKEKITFKNIFNKSSIELFFRREFLKENKILFDEEFGLGAKYFSGEENIFLSDIMKSGGTIAYIPEVVVYHQVPTSSSRLNDRNFIGKGPMLKRMHGRLGGFILLFVLWSRKMNMLDTPVKTLFKTINASFNYKAER